MDLEQNVISTVHSAITDAIKSKLDGYNTPLDALIKTAVERNQAALQETLDSSIKEALSGDFNIALKDACIRKLAKVLISKMEGEIEKQANELRSNPEFRAKLVLAISATIDKIGK